MEWYGEVSYGMVRLGTEEWRGKVRFVAVRRGKVC